jgi:hypothetical protein
MHLSKWSTDPKNLLIPTHSPAPWKIENGISNKVFLINDRKNHAIGELVYSDTRNPQDARLIEKAPELLAIVEELLQLHIAHHNNPTHAQARKLLTYLKGTA